MWQGCHNETVKSKISFLYLEIFPVECVRVVVVLKKEGADTTFLLVSMKIYLG